MSPQSAQHRTTANAAINSEARLAPLAEAEKVNDKSAERVSRWWLLLPLALLAGEVVYFWHVLSSPTLG